MPTALEAAAKVDTTMKSVTAALKKATEEALNDAGKIAKTEMEAAGRRYTGGNLAFSGMGGAKIGIRTRRRPSFLFVGSKGPWGLLEPGAKPHTIASNRASPALKIGGEWRAGPFKHPGTPNRMAWSSGADRTLSLLEGDIPRQIEGDVGKAFNG